MLSIRGVTKRFGTLTAVADLSLEVPAGTVDGVAARRGLVHVPDESCLRIRHTGGEFLDSTAHTAGDGGGRVGAADARGRP